MNRSVLTLVLSIVTFGIGLSGAALGQDSRVQITRVLPASMKTDPSACGR